MRRLCPGDADRDSIDGDSEVNTQNLLRPYPLGCCIMGKGSKPLTNLTSLCLSGSISLNLRDIGTSLSGLNELSVSHCHLESLDGIANFPNLIELYASFNNISDLSPCIYLEKISHIDLERNAILDTKSLEILSLCSEMVSAIFRENPFTLQQYDGALRVIQDYEKIVFNKIPQLKYVDRHYRESSEGASVSKNENLLPHHHLVEPPSGSEDCLMRCPTSVKAFSRSNLPLDDTDLLLEKHLLGSNTSFISNQSEMLSTSGKIYCGSPGRAFKSGIGSSSNISTRNTTPVNDTCERNM